MTKSLAWIFVVVAIVGVGVIAANLQLAEDPITDERTRIARVMVIRDLDELRFTNDSGIDLRRCNVIIDGYRATLPRLQVQGRARLARSEFSRDLPGDEFYRRSRQLEMGCFDEAGLFVEIVLK